MPSESQPEKKIKILQESPDPMDDTAHFHPIIDYLLSSGHTSAQSAVRPFEFHSSMTGRSYGVNERIDWDSLLQHFEFPDSVLVEPRFGRILDDPHGLTLFEGPEPIPTSSD